VKKWQRYSGSGNTFVLSHDPDLLFDEKSSEQIRSVCQQYDVDGLIVVRPSSRAHCRMLYMNRDGSRGSMCGNGLRCTAHFVFSNFFSSPQEISIETDRGVHRATIRDDLIMVEVSPVPDLKPLSLIVDGEKIETKVAPYPAPGDERRGRNANVTPRARVSSLAEGQHEVDRPLQPFHERNRGQLGFEGVFVDTGVPHLLIPVSFVSLIDVEGIGKKIRYHRAFHPDGVNVNFIEYKKDFLGVRTYERGVETETGSCGTGMVGAAALFFHLYPKKKRVEVLPLSRERLTVYKKGGVLFLEGTVNAL